MLSARLFSVIFLCFITLFLSACSRDNPVSIPPDYVEPDVLVCEESTDKFQFINSIIVDRGRESISLAVDQAVSEYSSQVGFLSDRIKIRLDYDKDPSLNPSEFDSSVLSAFEDNLRAEADFSNSVDTFIRDRQGLSESDPLTFPMVDAVTLNSLSRDGFIDLFVEQQITEEIDLIEFSAVEITLTANEDSAEIVDVLEPLIDSEFINLTSDTTNVLNINVAVTIELPTSLSDCGVTYYEEELTSIELDRNYTLEVTKDSDASLSAYLPLDTDEGDLFGNSVSVGKFINLDDEPTNVMAVGVPYEDSNSEGISYGADAVLAAADNSLNDSGAALVYIEESGNFTLDAYIKAPNSDSDDNFGHAVSLDGRYLAISAPGEDSESIGINNSDDNNFAENSGAVYVFERSADTDLSAGAWSQIAYIKPPYSALGINGYDMAFGSNVLLRDNRLFVGAPGESSAEGSGLEMTNVELESGAVFVYRLTDTGWTFSQAIKAPEIGSGDRFGFSFDIDSSWLAVGAPSEDSAFRGIKLPADIIDDQAGVDDGAVSILDNSRQDSGAAYIYSVSRTGVIEFQAYLKPTNSDANDQFGFSVAVSDENIFVGSPYDDSNGTNFNLNLEDNSLTDSGAVFGYSYDENIDGWFEYLYMKAPEPKQDALYGLNLALDLNDLMVGAPYHENSETGDVNSDPVFSSGLVYHYQFSEFVPVNYDLNVALKSQILPVGTFSADTEESSFGLSLDIFGEYQIIGAPGNTISENAGDLSSSNLGSIWLNN